MHSPHLKSISSFTLILFFSATLSAQTVFTPEIPKAEPEIQNGKYFLGLSKKELFTYGAIAHSAYTFYVEYKWWWEGNYHPFQYAWEGFENDYSLGVDKVGHFYTSYLYFNGLKEVMQWANFDSTTIAWTALGIPFLYALSIEIGDGFSTYQFSPDDLISNCLGMGYGYLQYRYSFFKNFKIKWSYYPSDKIPLDKYWILTDDYDGHLYWLSMNMHNLLPKGIDRYWPKELNLAIGYGGKNLSGRSKSFAPPIQSDGLPLRKFVISLDYNLTELPSFSGAWDTFIEVIDNIHFPAPGVRMVEGEKTQVKAVLVN